MTDLAALPPAWGWLIAGLVLAIAEMLVPGVFLIWLGVAAGVTGLVALALPLPVAAQFVLFAILSVAAIYAGRRWFAAHETPSDDPLLNQRTTRLIGRTVTVVAAIDRGEGRVRVGDGEWPARGPDAVVGAEVRIVGAAGNTLLVEPIG